MSTPEPALKEQAEAPKMPAKLLAHIEKMEFCWNWTAFVGADGYGKIRWNKKWVLIHRVVYELLVGSIPTALTLDHLCRNRKCCNPAHLEPVTFKENVLRGIGPTALNARKTICPKGHNYERFAFINVNGSRECRICASARKLKWQRYNRKAVKFIRSLGLGTRNSATGI